MLWTALILLWKNSAGNQSFQVKISSKVFCPSSDSSRILPLTSPTAKQIIRCGENDRPPHMGRFPIAAVNIYFVTFPLPFLPFYLYIFSTISPNFNGIFIQFGVTLYLLAKPYFWAKSEVSPKNIRLCIFPRKGLGIALAALFSFPQLYVVQQVKNKTGSNGQDLL